VTPTISEMLLATFLEIFPRFFDLEKETSMVYFYYFAILAWASTLALAL
jgi:hypothetical protein